MNGKRIPVKKQIRTLCSQQSPEILKKMVVKADEQLDRLIKVSSTLLGLGFIFTNFIAVEWLRVLIIICFFIALVVSFIGVLPFRVRYDIEEVSDIKKQEIETFLRKRRYLWGSAIIMALGFTIAIVDLFIDLFQNIGTITPE